jgi:hypothetical protein
MLPTREPILYGFARPDPSQSGISSESTLANDPWPLEALSIGFELVLRRPIETTALIRCDPCGLHKKNEPWAK